MVILDTDHLSILERQSGSERNCLRRRLLAFAQPLSVTATIISYEEQLRGWLSFIAQAKSKDDGVLAYDRLLSQLKHYCSYKMLAFDDLAGIQFENLKQRKIRVGTLDLKIAAIALTNNATLLTRNTQDFQKVPNLKIDDWTKP